MKTKKITQTVKALFFVCLFLPLTHLTAQNTADYKYKVFDPFYEFVESFEINNRYYIFTRTHSENSNSAPFTSSVMVFDEDLNKIKEFPLPITNKDHYFNRDDYFYADNYFYIIGLSEETDSILPKNTFYFAKYDTNFQPVLPIVYYILDAQPEMRVISIMTKNNEFMVERTQYDGEFDFISYLWYLDNNGILLREVPLENPFLGTYKGESDNHYFCSATWNNPSISRINKNDLEDRMVTKTPVVLTGFNWVMMDGSAVVVNNTFIRGQVYFTNKNNKCTDVGYADVQRGIAFYNEDLNLKDSLILGLKCKGNEGIRYGMSYINPDSIYYVYYDDTKYYDENLMVVGTTTTISIANFSHNGRLNFDVHLDNSAEDPLSEKSIDRAIALSNGGVLIHGYSGQGSYLLTYQHKSDLNIQETAIAKREIYPNPVQSQFTVTNTENADIQLFNVLGQKVFQTIGTQENTVVNTASLPQGLYVLKVVRGDFSTVHKVQIVR